MIAPTTHPGPLGTAEVGGSDPLAALRHPIDGAALLDAAGTITAGTYADGRPVRWPLGDGRQARHTTLVGWTRSGKTVLVRAILDAAAATGLPAQAIDLADGELDRLPHPVADSVTAARIMLADLLQVAASGYDEGGCGLRRLLVLDGLDALTRDSRAVHLLNGLSMLAGPAGITIVATTQIGGLDQFGSHVLGSSAAGKLRRRLAGELVLLRTDYRTHYGFGIDARLPLIPTVLDGDVTTAGIGYLPRRCRVPFRAWLP